MDQPLDLIQIVRLCSHSKLLFHNSDFFLLRSDPSRKTAHSRKPESPVSSVVSNATQLQNIIGKKSQEFLNQIVLSHVKRIHFRL